jgi:gluconolactonase
MLELIQQRKIPEETMSQAMTVKDQLGFIEGPAWSDDGRLHLVSISHGCVYVLAPNGSILETIQTGGGPNGLALAQDAMFVAQNGGIFGASGKARPGIQKIKHGSASYVFDADFKAPNDLCFGPDGRLYVSDPATDKAVLEPIEGRVFACDPVTGECEVVIDGRYFPNGLAFDATGQYFYLAQTYSRLIERFRLVGGTLKSEGTFCTIGKGRPDGIALDQDGKLWVCTPSTGGVEVFDRDGKPVRRIELGEGTMTTNCCFGGPDGNDLFVTAAAKGSLLRLRADSPGLKLLPFRE